MCLLQVLLVRGVLVLTCLGIFLLAVIFQSHFLFFLGMLLLEQEVSELNTTITQTASTARHDVKREHDEMMAKMKENIKKHEDRLQATKKKKLETLERPTTGLKTVGLSNCQASTMFELTNFFVGQTCYHFYKWQIISAC